MKSEDFRMAVFVLALVALTCTGCSRDVYSRSSGSGPADPKASDPRAAPAGGEDHCCRKVLQKAGLAVDMHVVATDLGIEKQPAEPHLVVDTKKVVDHVVSRLAGVPG